MDYLPPHLRRQGVRWANWLHTFFDLADKHYKNLEQIRGVEIMRRSIVDFNDFYHNKKSGDLFYFNIHNRLLMIQN